MTTTRLTGPQMVAVQTATQHLPHRMSMPYTGNVTTVDQLVAFLTTYAAHAEERHARASAEGRDAQRAVTALRSLRYALGLTTEALQVHDAEVAQADAIRGELERNPLMTVTGIVDLPKEAEDMIYGTEVAQAERARAEQEDRS